MTTQSTEASPVLIDGSWCPAAATSTFTAANPTTGEGLSQTFPVSAWSDIDRALDAAQSASRQLRDVPSEAIAGFLNRYADGIESRADEIAELASTETGLPVAPRLAGVELPRTVNQLRLAAAACADGKWRMATRDDTNNIHSVLEPIGPVLVFGPNNFPLAFNGISGGDFAAAIAAGNPVIAKAHPLHPATTMLLAEIAQAAIGEELPASMVQLVYGMSNEDGLRAVADPRLGAVGFTGSRIAGTALKASADAVGKPIYLEMSSVNPVVFLPGALAERFDELVTESATSGLMAAGQFCTNPGLMIALEGETTDRFIAEMSAKYSEAPCSTLLGKNVMEGLAQSIEVLKQAGGEVITGASNADRDGFAYSNTMLRATGDSFIDNSEAFQTEAFGNCTLFVVAKDVAQVAEILALLEGNLTGSVYSAADGTEEASYQAIAPVLREKVGRLLNDKMPTGVAVSPAMNHGGPFPATGHPFFTAVGIPGALLRFTRLACYDNVRADRLPKILQG